MSLTKVPTITKVFLALVILGLTSGVLPGQPKDPPKTITVPALVQCTETVEIYSLVTGRLKVYKIMEIGHHVGKGTILAAIDAPVLEQEVRQAEHTLELVTAQLKVVEAQLLAAELAVREAKNPNEQETKRALVNKARAEVEVHKARIRVYQTAVDIARTRLRFTSITAPIAGVITRRHFSTGDLIRAADHGRSLPLFVLQDWNHMRVVIQVPEKSALLVKAGTRVELIIPNRKGPIQGTIARTAYAIEEGSMRAEMDVANTDGNLRPGMTCKATIHLEKAK
jgi:RND family efflux transporter MFP subunit